MHIELKQIELLVRRCRETYCFHADVWIDGTQAGSVSNSGGGECHQFTPPALMDIVAKHCQGMLPVKVGSRLFPMEPDLLINALLRAADDERQLRLLMRTSVVFLRNSQILHTTPRLSAPALARHLAEGVENLKTTHRAQTILNLLPFQAALELYAVYGGRDR